MASKVKIHKINNEAQAAYYHRLIKDVNRELKAWKSTTEATAKRTKARKYGALSAHQNRVALREYKEGLSCNQCGMPFKGKAYLCDFHHPDRENKKKNVSRLYTWKEQRAEISKCLALCSNCHRQYHNEQREGTGKGQW